VTGLANATRSAKATRPANATGLASASRDQQPAPTVEKEPEVAQASDRALARVAELQIHQKIPTEVNPPVESTLILIKPDAFEAALTGEIIARFERKSLKITALKRMTLDHTLAERHYAEHVERDFFAELVSFISSGPLVAMVLEGVQAVRAARQVIGATDPLEADPGSIRGDLAVDVGRNLVHGSDSAESAAREIALFFPEL
jgi:nucleoside-diphosphate kinase